jgi:hypothetical protein
MYKSNGSNTSVRRTITGASLAQLARHMTPTEKAIFAAEILDGEITLQGLTAKSVAHLVGINQSYLFAALRATAQERTAILAGTRPLMPERTRSLPTVIDWAEVDTGKIVEAIKMIGLDRTLEAAIAVEAEHAGT